MLRQQGVDLLSVNDDGGGGEKGRCCGHVLARLLLEGNSATGGHAGLEVLARVHDMLCVLSCGRQRGIMRKEKNTVMSPPLHVEERVQTHKASLYRGAIKGCA